MQRDESLRVLLYDVFARTGTPPARAHLAAQLGLDEADVAAGLRRLAAERHVVLDADERIIMAHPFSAVPLGFSAMGARTLWWGGCAWDSFALPHLLPWEDRVLVATRCPACRRPLAFDVGTDTPPEGNEVAHFLVPAARMWDDVVHTCSHQRLFCAPACVDRWLERTGNVRGALLDLPALWRLAAGWYAGRLEPGYVRREPAEAKDYLRSVGL